MIYVSSMTTSLGELLWQPGNWDSKEGPQWGPPDLHTGWGELCRGHCGGHWPHHIPNRRIVA